MAWAASFRTSRISDRVFVPPVCLGMFNFLRFHICFKLLQQLDWQQRCVSLNSAYRFFGHPVYCYKIRLPWKDSIASLFFIEDLFSTGMLRGVKWGRAHLVCYIQSSSRGWHCTAVSACIAYRCWVMNRDTREGYKWPHRREEEQKEDQMGALRLSSALGVVRWKRAWHDKWLEAR